MRQIIINNGEDGYWVAECPSLPGCISQGETKAEAIELYIDALEEIGKEIPKESFSSVLMVV